MEHKCVRDSRPHLQQEGFEITYMFAWSGGYVNIDLMQSANQSDTGLMSVMTVEEIRNICGELGVLSYTDVAQAFGKETLSRELIQVAPYGKYFSSIMVMGFPVIVPTLCRPAKVISCLGSCRR
ncbi:hypothetical protein VitviT2T_020290 [Vitis vinifera]|uniref:Uncharacterized protein n=1 Tax=Vitis vinifera TaxID=29760 RepID=A0ABY9D5U6_VITVI|nr:hypothetical protein VitviT2T_020290 [Vitis vinifera]